VLAALSRIVCIGLMFFHAFLLKVFPAISILRKVGSWVKLICFLQQTFSSHVLSPFLHFYTCIICFYDFVLTVLLWQSKISYGFMLVTTHHNFQLSEWSPHENFFMLLSVPQFTCKACILCFLPTIIFLSC
jgi:hypothetical protein